MSHSSGVSRRLRPVLISLVVVATGLVFQAAPTTLPLPRPEALKPLLARAVTCASYPTFTGRLTASSSSTTAVGATTSPTVYGYVSNVDGAWSCTASVRYSAVAWNTTGSTGTFDWGNLINSTTVPCNWVVGSTDYLKANSTSTCPSTDAQFAMAVTLSPEQVYHNNAAHNAVGEFSFAHSDCDTYHGAEPIVTGVSFSSASTANRPATSNCDPIALDNTGTTQTITYDHTPPIQPTVTIAAGATSTASNMVSLTGLAASDPVSGVAQMRFSNDGATWSTWEAYAATRPTNWDLTAAAYGGTAADGTKTVYAQFQDANSSGPSIAANDTIVLDRTGPTGSVSINAAATYTASGSVTLNLSATDTLSTVAQMHFSNSSTGPWSALEPYAVSRSGWDLTSATYGGTTAEGTKSVYVQFTDSLGNASSGTGISDTIIYDATPANPSPPDVSCAGTGVYQPTLNGVCYFRPAAASTLTVTASASDAVSGIYFLQFGNLSPTTNWTPSPGLPNSDTVSPFTQALTFNASTGSATIDVFARNGAGIDGSVRTTILTADSSLPSAVIAYPEAGRSVAGDIVITGTATDSQTFKEYQLEYGAGASPGSWTTIGIYSSPVAGTGTLATWSPGTLTGVYTLRLTVRDQVGNNAIASNVIELENSRRGVETYVTRVPFDLGGGYSLDIGPANGEARLARDLFSIPSFGPPQELGLTYSSLETTATGKFGTGWSSNLTQYLSFDATGIVVWHRADGGRVPFGQIAGVWTELRGHFETFGTGTGVYTITLKDQTRLTFENSGAGRLTKIENRFGKALTLAWSSSSATATDASGRATTLAIDSVNNRITGATDSAGRAWAFSYTGTDLTTITDSASNVTTLAYTSHALTTVTRLRSRVSGAPESVVWGIGYTSGKATSVTDPVNASVANTFTYNPTTTVVGLLKTYSPLVRNSSTYTLDNLGRATSILDPEGFTTSQSFDADSNALTVTRPITSGTSATTTYTYDTRGNLLTEVAPIDASTSVTTVKSYNATNDLLTKSEGDTDPSIKLVTKQAYDGSGHLTSVDVNCTTSGTTPPTLASSCTGGGTADTNTNLITNYAYTSNDQLAYEQDPLGRVAKHVYDASGNETSTIRNCTTTGIAPPAPFSSCTGGGTADARTNVTSSTAFLSTTTAGKAGLPTSTTDPLGNTTSLTYDALGRQLTEVLPGDSSIPALTRMTTYDELGDTLTGADSWTPPGGSLITRTTTHVYDLANREKTVTDPAGLSTDTLYDAAGDATSNTVNGVTTTHSFDGLGRATSDTVAGLGMTSRTFDAQGNETSTTGSDGVVTNRTFSKTGWLLTETVDPAGDALTTTHAYDKLGRETKTIDPTGTVSRSGFDRAGRACRTVPVSTQPDTAWAALADVCTSSIPDAGSSMTHDRQGSQTSATDPTGSLTTTTYDPLDRPTVVIANDVASPTLPTQDVTTTTYHDAAGTTIAVLDPSGKALRTMPNVRGLAAKTIANCTDTGTAPPSDPAACVGAGTSNATTNVVTTVTYDGTGATLLTVVAQGTGAQASSETAYDAAGRVQAVKDPMGTITRTVYDAAGHVGSTVVNCTNTGTTVPTTGWESCAGTGTQDGTFNLITSYTYDARGNQTSQTAPNGRLTTLVYDTADRLVTRIDNDVASPTGPTQDVTTNYYFDSAGRQAAVRMPTPDGTSTLTTRYLYNDDGTLFREIHNCTDSGTTPPTNPGLCTGTGTGTDSLTNVVTEYAYDAHHNRIKTITPDPAASATGTGLITTQNAYDAANRLCRVVENATGGTNLQTLTDPCSTATQGTATTTQNLSTRYGYDGNGNLTSMVDALGQTTTYAYDQRGQPISTTDALGKTIVWTYDDLGHRVSQENRSDPPFTNSVVWTYDGAGRILTRVADGITTTYTYDVNGNKLTASDGTLTISSTFDRLDRVLTVDDEDAGTTADTTYTYSLTSPSWTDPTGTYGATLDKFDRATATNDPANATDFTTTFGADGQPLAATDPSGNGTALVYDRLGRLTTKNTTAAGPVNRALYGWTYNRAGQILSETSTITGDPANGQIDFQYDPLARLTSSALAGTTTAYGWDKVPNRTSVQVGAGTAATTTFNAANRPISGANPTAAYSSDDDGRLTARPGQTMTWDDLGRLKQVKNGSGMVLATYTYDPLDRLRMVDYGASVRTRFRYVGLTTSVAQLIDDAAGTVTRNIGNGWTGERLLDWTGTNSNIRIYGTNAHHDVTWLASSTGTVSQALRYDPWGNPRSTVPTGYTPFRFQGSFYDATTDLSWVVTRWYAPALGTFISEDGLLGQPRDPDSRHLYAYGSGDPVARWDQDGMAALGSCAGYGCVASNAAGVRLAQLQEFFRRFPGVRCGYHCYGYVPNTEFGYGTPILDFMKWESSRINHSIWWRIANREIVQGALSAWRAFDLSTRPPSNSSSLYLKYIKGHYLTAGPFANWRSGYYGGSRDQMWTAHQGALWEGVRKAAPYYSWESSEEQLVIYKVLVNVEWYYRSVGDTDMLIGSAIRLASYPGYDVMHRIPTRSSACNMWYVRTLTLSFFSIYIDLDPFFFTGDKPAIQRRLCG